MAFLDETGLLYYDTKIKEYITQKVGDAVGNITSFRFEIVAELPQTGEVGVVYLKALAELESSNLYEEFIWVDDSYEFIGTNEIDLSNYYTKEETDKLVEDSAYTLPTASATELGGIKVGNNLTIENGVLSVAGDFTGEPGAPGESLQYNWEGTKLGVKTTSETEYVYTDLKGAKGDKGDTGETGADGVGIASIVKTSTSDLVDTYTITYTDESTSTFDVTNGEKGDKGETGPRGPEGPKGAGGEGIDSIVKTSTSGLVDTYTITYTDDSTSTFNVTNGEQGPQGNGFYAMTEEDIEELIQILAGNQTGANRDNIIDVLLSEANGKPIGQGMAEGLYAYFSGSNPNYYLIDGYLLGNIVCEYEGDPVNHATYYEMHELKGEQGPAGDSVTITTTTSSTEDGGANTVTFSDGTVLTVYNGKTGSTGTASVYEAGQNISIQDGEISALGYTYDGVSTVDFGNNIVKFEQGSSIKEVDRSLAVFGDSGLELKADGNIKIASEANLVETISAGDIKTTTDNGSIYMTAGTNIELDAEVIKLSTALILSDVNVDGKVNASEGFFQTSDITKKNVVSELDLNKAYDLVDKCQAILYTLKEDAQNTVLIGLIAQEVQEIFPELVTTTADGSLALDYSRLTVVILRVLKDLIVRIQNLESK